MTRADYHRAYYAAHRAKRIEQRRASWSRTGRPPKHVRYARELGLAT